MYGVETCRAVVTAWYDRTLQDIIFYERQQPEVRRMICSIVGCYPAGKNEERAAPSTHRVITALNRYRDYFDQPGWTEIVGT